MRGGREQNERPVRDELRPRHAPRSASLTLFSFWRRRPFTLADDYKEKGLPLYPTSRNPSDGPAALPTRIRKERAIQWESGVP